jgi:hypothetical protein
MGPPDQHGAGMVAASCTSNDLAKIVMPCSRQPATPQRTSPSWLHALENENGRLLFLLAAVAHKPEADLALALDPNGRCLRNGTVSMI